MNAYQALSEVRAAASHVGGTFRSRKALRVSIDNLGSEIRKLRSATKALLDVMYRMGIDEDTVRILNSKPGSYEAMASENTLRALKSAREAIQCEVHAPCKHRKREMRDGVVMDWCYAIGCCEVGDMPCEYCADRKGGRDGKPRLGQR